MKKKIVAIAALALCTALCIAAAAHWPRAEAVSQSETPEPAPANPDPVDPAPLDPGTTDPDPADPGLTPGNILPLDMRSVGFNAQYLRTDGYHSGVRYPQVIVIRSAAELSDYYEANKDRYNLSGFPAACEKYDDAYFSNRILLAVLLEAGSGSVRYQVTDVARTGVNRDVLSVAINVMEPEAGTCDMAEWHILIEPAAGVFVSDAEHVSVNLHATGMGKLPDPDIREKITEEQAVEIAKTVVTVEYDCTEAWFDQETATWQVNFYREGWAGGDQTVTLDEYGTILGSTYGE